MKKIKILTLSLTAFIAVNLNALTLDDAVSIALKNNFEIQGKNYDYMESLENINPLNKFLSVCEGVIARKKKIIITTNIDSINQLYPALIRPGRCFDVQKFRALSNEESLELSNCYNKKLIQNNNSITLSEFYAFINDTQNKNYINNKLGYK